MDSNNQNFKVGCFYTKDTAYEEAFNTVLKPSLIKLGLSYIAIKSVHKGSWTKNVAEKPRIILETLDKLEKDENLIFLDVDSEIRKSPDLFRSIPLEHDMALHYLDWDSWYSRSSHTKELLSGTLFIRNRDNVKRLLNEWYQGAVNSTMWEQKVLEKILKNRTDINIYELPITYCYMNTLPNGQPPVVQCDPVIVHYQISRKMKRIMGR